MGEMLQQFADGAASQDTVWLLAGVALFVVLGLALPLGFLYLLYFFFTLPLRRNERARLSIELLELGLKEGHTAEAALVDAAASKDRSLGKRFLLLAFYLNEGMRLSQALEKVPHLLPPQVQAILKAGERMGDLARVLPACRLALRDGVSQVRGALNYLVLLAFVATPFTVIVPMIIKAKILPSYQAVFDSLLSGMELPAFSRLVFFADWRMLCLQSLILLLVWSAALLYVVGPGFRGWLARQLRHEPLWLDWLICRLPWRRMRLQRDFSSMLAVMLEAGMPEAEALQLAGDATANAVFRRRADAGCALLHNGAKLSEAIEVLDDSAELRWRLANAFQRAGGFVAALNGWHEALDAKAFQLEQAAAQIITTSLVLLNGVMIGSLVIGIFLVLIQLLNQATLW